MSLATDRARNDAAPPTPRIDRPLAIVSALAGVGALAVSSCCALPLAFALVGIGAGWLGDLEAFAAYRPTVLGVAGVALVVAWAVFVRRQRAAACAADGACAPPPRRWVTGGILVLATAIFGLGAVFPSIENDVLGSLIRLQ